MELLQKELIKVFPAATMIVAWAFLFFTSYVASPAFAAAPASAPSRGYCSGVKFLSENAGVITDGAIDTGMGVYHANTDCKWVIKPAINEVVEKIKQRVVLHFEYLVPC